MIAPPVHPASPIIVRVIGPPTDAVTLGDVILRALGLTGAMTLLAVVLGIVLAGVLIGLRAWRPAGPAQGASGDDLSLHLSE